MAVATWSWTAGRGERRKATSADYLCEASTARSVRSDDWYMTDLGSHETFDSWIANGRKDVLTEAHERVTEILASHEPLPLGDEVEKELKTICKHAGQR